MQSGYNEGVVFYIWIEVPLPAAKKIIVSIPDSLLAEIDLVGAAESKNRSEIVPEAIRLYIRNAKMDLCERPPRDTLKWGY